MKIENSDSIRTELLKSLFPMGVPSLWCPPLTHYRQNGTIDFDRMEKHINHIAPFINSFLIPGSTGDGWEITFDEYKQILDFIFTKINVRCELNILIGLLRTDYQDVHVFLEYALEYLQKIGMKTNFKDAKNSRFKGFVICAPKGTALSQNEIKSKMSEILKMELPTVIYQLPQITENEISPELIAEFVSTYPNFYMMKDSSGLDHIANASEDYRNLVLLRGAEGDYHRFIKESGGNYDGFLLSTGNTFAMELKYIVDEVLDGNQTSAEKESSKLTEVINKVFEIATTIPFGNAFTNANKLLDHIMAFGNMWQKQNNPKTHAGEELTAILLSKVDEILRNSPYYPEQGYL